MNPAQLERLSEYLHKLRLFKSRERLEALLQQAASEELAYADFLELVLAEEVAAKTSTFVTNISKAKVLDDARLAKITDAYTAMSLRLQSAFGLRREESIKIVPAWADGGDRLQLKDTWTKGGKYREIAIRIAVARTSTASLNLRDNRNICSPKIYPA
nr:integrase domain-containing protein [Duganella sp. BJB475]